MMQFIPLRLQTLLLALLALGVWTLHTPAAHAEQTYTVGVEDIDYYPIYAGHTGDYQGYVRELLDAFAEKQGVQLLYEPLPVKRLFNAFLERQEVDLKFPDNPYWNADMREGKNVVYSEGVLDYIDGVMVLPENKGQGKKQLKVLGIISGFTAWEYLGDIENGSITTEESSDYVGLLKKTLAGRLDGAYSNVTVAAYHLSNMGQEGALVFDDSLPHTRSKYYLSSIKHPELVEAFNAFLIEEAEKVEALKAKYDVKLAN